ncbi:MAG: hypothetical protein WCW13_02140 [archaeon]|jgi:hypothetical protein
MRPNKSITSWAAGGRSLVRGQKSPSPVAVEGYLKSLQKKGGLPKVRFIQGVSPNDLSKLIHKLEHRRGVKPNLIKKRK